MNPNQQAFVAESRALLQTMQDRLLQMEFGDGDAETINAVFHAVHTLYSAAHNLSEEAGDIECRFVTEFVRELENVLDAVRSGTIAPDAALVEVLLECAEHLGALLACVEYDTEPDGDSARDGKVLCDLLHQYLGLQSVTGKVAEQEPPEGVRREAPAEPLVVAATEQGQNVDKKADESMLVRVSAAKLDQLIDLVGEMVIASAGASMLAHKSGETALVEATSVITMLVEQIRDSALQLRMVQIGETFNRFQRVVRDVSRELHKDVELVISGSEAELDKTMVEKLGDPLMNLIRNALEHGIESPVVRAEKNKPPQGMLKLNAYHESGSIVIEISDDGAGLNKEKILARARERELVSHNQALSDGEIYALIFEPGFSFSSKGEHSGAGLDVVKRGIAALRGTVEVESTEGMGTTFRLHLPLTLAIIDGFLVGVGKSAYVIPLGTVDECIELSEDDKVSTVNHQYINLRGEVLPFVRLRDQFEVAEPGGRRENIVVVQHAGQKIGLVVDELMGEFQTVIKPLGSIFKHIKGIGGSTILGSGDVALILDVQSLVALTTAQQNHEQVAEAV